MLLDVQSRAEYLVTEESVTGIAGDSKGDPKESRKINDQHLIPKSSLEKSGEKLELELEHQKSSKKRRRGRKPRTPVMKQVEQAYVHLHDLDWLQDSDLAQLPEVQERLNPMQVMPEAQALRELLMQAATQVVKDMASVPDKAGVRAFLEGYLRGKSVTEVAEELGVSREWASRAYRREAFGLATMQFIKLISSDSPTINV